MVANPVTIGPNALVFEAAKLVHDKEIDW